VILHVSGEEKGLLGSRWWVRNSTVPIEQVVANINVDMIGGEAAPDTVAVLGADYSSLGPLTRDVNARHPELGLTTSGDLWPQEQLFFRSDQLNFMAGEIPALFFFAGLHECYHRPCDDVDFVSTDKIARVARFLAYVAYEIANADEEPEWDAQGLAEVRRLISGGG
jgi:Zn-dependent M28 family amino/carboxypeptidase